MEFAARVSMAYVFTSLFGDGLIFFAEPSAWFGSTAVLMIFCLREVSRLPKEPDL